MKKFLFSLAIMVPMSVVDSANAGRSALLARESMELIPRALQIARTRWGGTARDYSANSQAAEATQPVTPTSSSSKVVQPKKTVRILSIDGGGIRGVVPLTILSEIEKQTGRNICQLFDVIAGTSTGGIIALGLNRKSVEERRVGDGTRVSPEISDKKSNTDTFVQDIPSRTDRKVAEIRSAATILKMYKERNGEIFNPGVILKYMPSFVSFLSNTIMPKYSSKSLKNVLQSEFGDQIISESFSTLIIPAYDIKDSRVHVFTNLLGDSRSPYFYMRDVALATGSAPTYFKPARITPLIRGTSERPPEELKEDLYMVDGGVSANNPTLLAYSYAKKAFPEANDFFIVSLGTGTRTIGFTNYEELKGPNNVLSWMKNFVSSGRIKGSGFLGWARKFTGLMINASSSSHEYCLDNLVQRERYHRYQPELPDGLTELDSTNKEIIDALESHAKRMIFSNDFQATLTKTLMPEFQAIIDELHVERPYVDGRLRILIPGVHLATQRRSN